MSDVSENQRDYFRVDGELYMWVDTDFSAQTGEARDAHLTLPTFYKEEDDIVGLMVDSFREKLLMKNMEREFKDSLLEMQNILSHLKIFVDSVLQGKQHKKFKKLNVNISGSGIAFSHTVPVMVSREVFLGMFFPRFPYKFIGIPAKVMRCEKQSINDYLLRCDFENISEARRDDILRFVNQCQRDGRKR